MLYGNIPALRVLPESVLPELILRLALPSPLRRLFDYRAPTGLTRQDLQPGMRLRVPFGRREVVGILVELRNHSEIAPEKLKPALQLLDPHAPLPAAMLKLCLWAAQYYQHSLGDTFSWALPVLLRQGEPAELRQERYWSVIADASPDDPRLQRAPRQREALVTLAQHPHGVAHQLLSQLQLSRDSLELLQDKGLVASEVRRGKPIKHQGGWLAQAELPLNTEQASACNAISAGLDSFNTYLLAGVTGSGKTEVYLQLIHQTLKAGKQALVLIPEINLGPQTLERFTRRFNARIVLLHSAVNDRERLDAWLAGRDGEADIIIGTRSALFTPMKCPGLIIIDEEHDASYKQQEGLRYHARDLALVRAHQEDIPIVLGSATPSLESLQNAYNGRYALLRLTQRAGGAQPPRMLRLDIKSRPLDSGISAPMQQAIEQTLQAGQQVLVFLNRRGFAPTLLCHDCGWISQCTHCDARMTLHQRSAELRCHHCGHSQKQPKACPDCHKLDLRPVGAGTERAEERLNTLFPQYPVMRIDRDSTSRKGAMDKLFHSIQRGEPCILVGTQMLAKGHHFPRVTLVAILDADGGLFSADFRGSEHTAQLIVQVAGRAGRAGEPGRVIIQSHLADHPLLVQLTEQGYFAFAEQALSERRAAGLPPFSHLALSACGRSSAGAGRTVPRQGLRAGRAATRHAGLCWRRTARARACPHGAPRRPPPCAVAAAGRQPRQSASPADPLVAALEQLPGSRSVRWSLDVDPIDLF